MLPLAPGLGGVGRLTSCSVPDGTTPPEPHIHISINTNVENRTFQRSKEKRGKYHVNHRLEFKTLTRISHQA